MSNCTNAILEILIPALIMVESGGNDSAIGKNGEVGCLQLKKITVDDCNRIVGKKLYSYSDRLDRQKSIEMCEVVLNHYGSHIARKGLLSVENLALVWNMGYVAWRDRKPNESYAKKVKDEMKGKGKA